MTKWTKVIVLDNDIQAMALESELKARQIPHFMRSYHDIAYNGLFQTQKGWGHVEAPADYHQQIKDIFAALMAEADDDKE